MSEIYDVLEELREPKSLSMFASKPDMLVYLLESRQKAVEAIEKLREEIEALKDDYQRRHKDATDRYLEVQEIRRHTGATERGGERGGEVMEWRPIESAPKDGTQILAVENFQYEWEDDQGITRTRTGDWSVVKWHPQHEEWMSYGLMLSSFEPTNWMPLPEPPK